MKDRVEDGVGLFWWRGVWDRTEPCQIWDGERKDELTLYSI